jgi:hypothetical protein
MEPHLFPERNDASPGRPRRFALQCAAMKPRLPFADELPPSGPRRWAVLAMLVAGGVVALLVPVFFAIVLFGLLRGWGG